MSIHAPSPVPEQVPSILGEHDELVTTIEARDEGAFTAALRAHLDRTHRR
jgi:DNA-binding GntR family transcriptional regulator